jgi:hypothetical protein
MRSDVGYGMWTAASQGKNQLLGNYFTVECQTKRSVGRYRPQTNLQFDYIYFIEPYQLITTQRQIPYLSLNIRMLV